MFTFYNFSILNDVFRVLSVINILEHTVISTITTLGSSLTGLASLVKYALYLNSHWHGWVQLPECVAMHQFIPPSHSHHLCVQPMSSIVQRSVNSMDPLDREIQSTGAKCEHL